MITSEVFDFIFKAGILTDAARKGSEIHITAFPYDMVNYIKEADERKKRYYACHCPFARESILKEGAEVSRTLCYCSLCHAKVMWEAILNMELDGEVLQSVLGGDLMCKYAIYLPAITSIMIPVMTAALRCEIFSVSNTVIIIPCIMKTWSSSYNPFNKFCSIAPYYQQTLWFGFITYSGC
ncbi:MAG: hypothetical protein GX115_08990 [Ruminiclostridium sp.]|nr:hypothetical protein [Ruminiclostridium sp.]